MRKLRVFVIWRNQKMREDIQQELETEGFEVTALQNADNLSLMRDIHQPDIVVAYVRFADMYPPIYKEITLHNIPTIIFGFHESHSIYKQFLPYKNHVRLIPMLTPKQDLINDINALLEQKQSDLEWLNQIYENED